MRANTLAHAQSYILVLMNTRTGQSVCANCPAGSWRSGTYGNSSADCTNCTVGKYGGVAGETSNTCQICPAGCSFSKN